MNVLIVGGGGREHALAWKAGQSSLVDTVYVAPGNAGTAAEPGIENVAIDAVDVEGLVSFVSENNIALTIVGPEAPLVAGIVDRFRDNGLSCFGPTRAAAALEGSKVFSKDFLQRHRIPTAGYAAFTDVERAIDHLRSQRYPVVIKADGLAAGKGVIIAQNESQAISTASDMLAGNKFGDAGHRIVIEEFLQGEEASFIVMSDGEHILPLASSQDHKARDAGDRGPNTGGMGAYSPAPVVTPEVHDRIMQDVIKPTIEGMAAEGRPYTGFLYAGIMLTEDGTPNVLEFNCRFGDPEAQPVIMRLKSDLVTLCQRAIVGDLQALAAEWDERAALGVVLASRGYPESAGKGDVISGLDMAQPDNVKVFHAGTKRDGNDIVTAGGRVLCVTALGDDVAAAKDTAYMAVDRIHWDGMFYREDIGHRAVHRGG